MKRIFALLVTLTLCIMTFTPCVAEATTVFEGEEIYYVVRPHIKFVMEDGESTRLSFGDKVTVTSTQDNYAFIETADGQKGKVTIGFIMPITYPMLWLDEIGCYLSPQIGLDSTSFGYGACGQRYEERALILFESDGYYFIVTDEGYSGFISVDDPHIALYTDQVPSGT